MLFIRQDRKKKRYNQSLPPTDELFLTLICLHVGLMEQDLPYRFNVSQSTVSRTIITGINFMYLELKKIPFWPPKEVEVDITYNSRDSLEDNVHGPLEHCRP